MQDLSLQLVVVVVVLIVPRNGDAVTWLEKFGSRAPFEEVTVRAFAEALAAQLSPPKSADSLRLHLSLSRNAVPSSSTLTLYPILDEDAGKKVFDQWRTLQDAAAAQGKSF
eukprot:GSA25T00020921001.1